ncbi:MAG: glycosyltransferase family 4 protein [Planctomycetes bacterium]|nr:glycosyltransferase family 4 protein [Planctomycetota bacterium]
MNSYNVSSPRPTGASIHADGLIFGLQRHGGVHRATQNLLIGLERRRDVQLRTYLPEKTVSDMSWLPPECVQHVPAPIRLRPGRVFSQLNRTISARRISEMWGRLDAGVFLATYYSTYPSLRIPQITVIHDMIYELFPDLTLSPQQEKHKADKRQAIAAADVIVCPSDSARRDVESLCDTTGKILRVIPWGVESEYRPTDDSDQVRGFVEKITSGAPYLLYVGGRDGTKNFVPLAMAYSRWAGRRDIHLLSVGGGSFSNQENSIFRALRLTGRVHCVPALSNLDLVLAYNGASACVMPSLYEGYGFPVLEAMACGCPVAASNVSSLPEVGGDAAIYFDPTDHDSIVTALEEVIRVPKNGDRVARGLERAGELTWTRAVESLVETANEISNTRFPLCRH